MLDFIKNRNEEFKEFCNKDCPNCKLVQNELVTGENESCFQIYALISALVDELNRNEKLVEENLYFKDQLFEIMIMNSSEDEDEIIEKLKEDDLI